VLRIAWLPPRIIPATSFAERDVMNVSRRIPCGGANYDAPAQSSHTGRINTKETLEEPMASIRSAGQNSRAVASRRQSARDCQTGDTQ
jgi:hypothetical protein